MTETPETPPASGDDKMDPVGEFKKLPGADKLLLAAAAATLAGFLFSGRSNRLFKFDYGWYVTLAFLGAVLVLVLVAMRLFGIKLMAPTLQTRVLLLLAILPAAGFVIDELRNFWSGFMLAGSITMAYAAAKITSREKIL